MEINSFPIYEFLQNSRRFVVEALEFWLKSSGFEQVVGRFIHAQDLKFCSQWDIDTVDLIGVVIVQEENIFLSADEYDR